MNGQELKEILRKNRYTSAEVARALGMTRQNFSMKLSAQDIKLSFLQSIAEATGIPLSEFIATPSTDAPQPLNAQQLTELVQSLTETVRLQQETIAHLVGVKSESIAPPREK